MAYVIALIGQEQRVDYSSYSFPKYLQRPITCLR